MRRLAWQSGSLLTQQRCMSVAASTIEAFQHAVPIEIVAAISQRTHGVVQLPEEVEQVLGKHLGGGSKKGLRADSQALLQELRSRSRSTARGGVNDLQLTQSSQEAGQPRLPKKKVQRKRQARWQDNVQLLTLPGQARGLAETVNIAEHGSATGAASDEEGDVWVENIPAQEQAAPQYDAQQAAAYMAARMPACYAAVYKVLEEVSMRLPGFAPESMLDFGAGPGTAIWAAHEVYGGQPGSVLAVEPSLEMSRLGQRIQAARAQVSSRASGAGASAEPTGDIRWASSLSGIRSNRSRRPTQASRSHRAKQQYDLVTAAYVLSELASDAERQQIIQELWDSTKGILVLVEPGTPSGYQYIINAREQVLQAGLDEETGLHESSVVAPCPHDGACPMQGTSSWCHFVQRFERSSLQRVTKVRQDGGLARTYQDERFSYVVLRRGSRKVGASQAISRHSSDAAEMHDPQPYLDAQPRSWKKSEARYQRALALENLMEEMGQFKDPEGESEVLEEATEYLIQQAIRLGDDEEDDLDSISEQAQTFTPASAAGQLEGDKMPEDDIASDGSASAMGHAEVDGGSTASEALWDSREAAAAGDCATEGEPAPPNARTRAERLQAQEVEQHDSYSSEQLDIAGGPELSEEQVAQLALATARQSSTWGRIIRPPRKKGRHVILDLCAPLSALPQHRRAELSASRQAVQGSAALPQARGDKDVLEHDRVAEEGALVRQVLAAADKKTWLGPAGYALARDSKWGDLWPSYYINRAIITKIENKPQ